MSCGSSDVPVKNGASLPGIFRSLLRLRVFGASLDVLKLCDKRIVDCIGGNIYKYTTSSLQVVSEGFHTLVKKCPDSTDIGDVEISFCPENACCLLSNFCPALRGHQHLVRFSTSQAKNLCQDTKRGDLNYFPWRFEHMVARTRSLHFAYGDLRQPPKSRHFLQFLDGRIPMYMMEACPRHGALGIVEARFCDKRNLKVDCIFCLVNSVESNQPAAVSSSATTTLRSSLGDKGLAIVHDLTLIRSAICTEGNKEHVIEGD